MEYYHKDDKLKIAVIGLKGLPAFGGAATVGENVIEQLKNKYEFTVYATSSHTFLTSGHYHGYEQIVFKKIQNKKLNSIYYYLISAFHAVFVGNYDLIHVHHRDASFILPLLRIRYKVILTTHGMVLTEKWARLDMIFKLQDLLFLRLTNYITCVSKKDLSNISRIKKSGCVFIPNGVTLDDALINKSQHDNFVLFAAGRIVPSKGCHIFLQALANVGFKDKVYVIGDLNQIPSYTSSIKKLAASLNVVFTGLIKEKTSLNEYIKAAKFFVFSSRIESMSMMLLEVAAMGTPIICSDIPENKDIFSEDEVLFFEVDNVLDLSEKITWANHNYNSMLMKSRKAYEKLEANHAWDKISEEYSTLYQHMI